MTLSQAQALRDLLAAIGVPGVEVVSGTNRTECGLRFSTVSGSREVYRWPSEAVSRFIARMTADCPQDDGLAKALLGVS